MSTILFDIFLKPSWTKATLLRIYFRNVSVQRYFLQYKSQCLKKVNVKYVINRLLHELWHIVPGTSSRSVSALQLHCRAWYGNLELIPGPIWKMSCNNLLIRINKYNYIICMYIFLDFHYESHTDRCHSVCRLLCSSQWS
jgi:hypothetical protein